MRTLVVVVLALALAALGCRRPSAAPEALPPNKDVPPGPATRSAPEREMQGSTPQVPPVVQP